MVDVAKAANAPSSAKTAVTVAIVFLVVSAIIFVPSGRLDWSLGWVYLGIITMDVAINWACLTRWNPTLIRRRMRIGKGTKKWDLAWNALFGPAFVAEIVVAGLEARRGDVSLPIATCWPLGFVIFALGSAMFLWSMVVNPFFEKTVRIQTELGHKVIDTGPYAWVRHPGYVGFSGWLLGTPLLLASKSAFLPAVLSMVGLLIRTELEDRTLSAELDGYPEYAARVRFRLIPGLW